MDEFDLKFETLDRLAIPAYFFSAKKIETRYSALKAAFPPEFAIYYSLKANAHAQILETLCKLGARADVASENELRGALKAGFNPNTTEFTGPGKSPLALELAIKSQLGSIVTESVQELLLIEQTAKSLGMTAQVSVRINPLKRVHSNGKIVDGPSSQFGIDEERLPQYFEALQSCPSVEFVGTHVYLQSQLLEADMVLKNLEIALIAAEAAARLYGRELNSVNLGGGFGIPYAEGDLALDLGRLRKGTDRLLARVRSTPGISRAALSVESGRYLVGPAGVYVAEVAILKESRGKKMAVLTGGFSQNMAACGFGQLFRRNYKVTAIQRTPASTREKVTLVGPSCYALDILANDIELPTLAVGDFVCFENCGSYGASFSPSSFLQFEAATEFFLESR